jgi:hypothetical protein
MLQMQSWLQNPLPILNRIKWALLTWKKVDSPNCKTEHVIFIALGGQFHITCLPQLLINVLHIDIEFAVGSLRNAPALSNQILNTWTPFAEL